jgi:hypothetical protein
VNFGKLFKVFDTVMSVVDATKQRPPEQSQSTEKHTPAPTTFAEQIEVRLTNVVVAALKEAFDRDHARLELERAHLEEQRRRAEEAARMELRRQAADRELGRLRLLAAAGLIGWIAPMLLLVTRVTTSGASRAALIGASVLSLCSLAFAFVAQARIGANAADKDRPLNTPASTVALGVLVAALGLAAVSLLL